MSVTLGRNDYLTMAGSLMVAVGAFMPMINIAGLNKVSYADASSPEVYLLVVLAVAASILIFMGKRSLSIVGGLGAWLVLLWPVISNMGGGSNDGGLLGKLTDAAADPLSKVTEKIFSNVLDFEVGGYVFLVGMLLVLIASVLNYTASRKA